MKRVLAYATLAALSFTLGLYFLIGVIQAGSFNGIGGYTQERADFNESYWGDRALAAFLVSLVFAVGAIVSWMRQRNSKPTAT